MNTSVRDAGIPVLTEVIETPAGAAVPLPEAAPAAPSYPAAPPLGSPSQFARAAASEQLELRAGSEWSKEQWSLLERHIRERILRQILDRIDALLEQRLRDTMSTVLQNALNAVSAEIKSSLHHSIEDVVTRAVSQELTRLQNTKK
jgi:hypothetical protein